MNKTWYMLCKFSGFDIDNNQSIWLNDKAISACDIFKHPRSIMYNNEDVGKNITFGVKIK